MSTSVASVVNHFPSAENGFTTTTSGSVASGATTVGLNSVAGYANGEIAVFVIDPTDVTKKQTFTGTIDTAGVQVTGVKWTAGSNTTHASGATVVDYATATHISMITKGLLVEHDQDGTHGAITATSITATTGTFTNITVSGTATTQGWTALGATPNTVTANGNRNYDLVFNSTDLTSTLSPGMKLQLTRTVAAPDQCADLEASSSQYFSKSSPAGMTFTDDFVCSAWIKVESYADMAIISRYNGTSGWVLKMLADGRLQLVGYNAGAANYSYVISYASLPLNKWIHVAAQLDMSAFTATTTTSYIMFDGVDVPAAVTRAGTNPTALVQAGNLEVGATNGGTLPFDGKLAQVAVYNAKVTQATIKNSMDRTLAGNETSLISAYSFDNTINDLSATANNLTAQGSAVATATDSPFANAVSAGLLEYAEINSVAFSTNTTVNVRVPDTCQIPTTGGISAVSYSTQSNPYGLPYFSRVIASVLKRSGGAIASGADIPGLTTTITSDGKTPIKIKMMNGGGLTGGASSGVFVTTYLYEGATILNYMTSMVNETANGNNSELYSETLPFVPTSGSHTYKVVVSSANAQNITLNGSPQAYLSVELV